jgi:nucleotide-binding universal stress UspA family protein
MYRKILVALENGPADETLLPHVKGLAVLLGSELLLVHVADGFAARHYEQLQLAESEEMKEDRAYLEREAEKIRTTGLTVETLLALGNPPQEILKAAETAMCDLIAMGSHGHRFFGDILYGSTISGVRHQSSIPVLVIPARKTGRAPAPVPIP